MTEFEQKQYNEMMETRAMLEKARKEEEAQKQREEEEQAEKQKQENERKEQEAEQEEQQERAYIEEQKRIEQQKAQPNIAEKTATALIGAVATGMVATEIAKAMTEAEASKIASEKVATAIAGVELTPFQQERMESVKGMVERAEMLGINIDEATIYHGVTKASDGAWASACNKVRYEEEIRDIMKEKNLPHDKAVAFKEELDSKDDIAPTKRTIEG